MLIDSHCHLDYYTQAELPDVLARAAMAGVGQMVTIGTTIEQSQRLPALIEGHDNLWCTVGVHPHHAHEAPIPTPERLAELATHARVIGIGESGLDYFYDKAPRDVQAENFRAHCERLGHIPADILHVAPGSAIEAVAMELTTQAIAETLAQHAQRR